MNSRVLVKSVCPYCGFKRHFYTQIVAEARVVICQGNEDDPVEKGNKGGCKKKYVVDYKLRAQVSSLAIIGEEDGN